jgi:hypothetical protein
MDNAATFGGAGTPVSGDTIALGGYVVSCSSDKRALADGITISGTGTLLIKSGGAFKTAANLPATCTLQFGEPEGEGDGPLPAVGALDANASGELVLNGKDIRVLGPCKVYTARRTGRGYGIVTGQTSTSVSVLDDATTDWQVGDIVTPFGLANAYEYAVTGWDSGALTLSHAAMAAGYNAVGMIHVRMSCAAHIRRTGTVGAALLLSSLTGDGDIYLMAALTYNFAYLSGSVSLDGRVATLEIFNTSIAAIAAASGTIGELYAPGYAVHYSVDKLAISGGVIKSLSYGGKPISAILSNTRLIDSIAPPAIGYPLDLTLIDCTLPATLISGSLAAEQRVRIMSEDGITDVHHTAGGVATKVQHAALPGTNDLPDAYLLAPVSDRAIFDQYITVRRGQSVRIRFHAWLSSEDASCGYEIFEDGQQVGDPLASYTLPADAEILEWHRPTPSDFYNDTQRDMLLRVRAWATGDNCYVRIAPEQGGGEL